MAKLEYDLKKWERTGLFYRIMKIGSYESTNENKKPEN